MTRRLAIITLAALALASCSYEDVEREIGYKGTARVNPWLAAERFAETSGFEVISTPSWQEPTRRESIWFIPAILIENQMFARQLTEWLDDGGHLVVFLENAESGTSDWQFRSSTPPVLSRPLRDLIEGAGISLTEQTDRVPPPVITAKYRNRDFRIDSSPHTRVLVRGDDGEPGAIASVHYGLGRLTVVADARIFRNRWIDTAEHADHLAAILGDADPTGAAGFMRGSGLSFWRLLGTHLWPVLIAFAAWLIFWLWRCFGRFGPLEAADEPNNIRGYDHHLEALGGFQWEIDHATGLLAPLRARIIESGHHLAARAGRPESEFHDLLATRTGIPRENISRALDPSNTPRDAASLTHLTADLQKILHHT